MPPSIEDIFTNTGVQRLDKLITPLSPKDDSPEIGKFCGGPMSVAEFVGRKWEISKFPGIKAPSVVFLSLTGGWFRTIDIKADVKEHTLLRLQIDGGKAKVVYQVTEERHCFADLTWVVAGPDPGDPNKIIVTRVCIGDPLPEPSEIALDTLPGIYRDLDKITASAALKTGFKYARVELIPP